MIDMGVEETIVCTAQALTAPLMKLIDTIKSATWAVYEPRYLVNMAKAQAVAANYIGEAARSNPDIGLNAQIPGLTLTNLDSSSVEYRGLLRERLTAVRKQVNIENIFQYAADELRQKEDVSPDPVDVDWATRFIGIAEDVSDENMQRIWAKILAGEVEKPNSYSKRTLEVLRNMSQKEAVLFQRVASTIVHADNECVILDCRDIKGVENGPDIRDILLLGEASLVCTENVHIGCTDVSKAGVFLRTDTEIASVRAANNASCSSVGFRAYKLTNAGRELLHIMSAAPSRQNFIAIIKNIQEHSRGVKITVHEIISMEKDGTIQYKKNNLLEEQP